MAMATATTAWPNPDRHIVFIIRASCLCNFVLLSGSPVRPTVPVGRQTGGYPVLKRR
jgi:hypothetical protein